MTQGPSPKSREPIRLSSIAARLLVMAGLWWILTEGRVVYQWPVGVLVIAAATWASLALKVRDRRRRRLSLRGIARFLPLFFIQSLRGGIDVARRAFSVRRRVRPAWISIDLHLDDEPPRVFMACVISLMPGTLSARLDHRHLRIHVLDESLIDLDALRKLEQHVNAVFRHAPR